MTTDYDAFISQKLVHAPPTGIEGATCDHPALFPFQRDLVQWALRRGRAAIFANTGLGKTRMQIVWAHAVSMHVGKPVLILAPLAVAAQTSAEGDAIGVSVTVASSGDAVTSGVAGVYVANYDKLHRFDPSVFGGVALDESSIVKNYTSSTLAALIAAFAQTSFRCAFTATPSPNDYTELGNHADLLGVCSRTEMLAEFFTHDGGETQKWRLKGHARKSFWTFVSSWGALVRSPADLGYDSSAYSLPPLTVSHHVIEADDATTKAAGMLFAEEASTLTERRNARRASLSRRVSECAALVNATEGPWVVWCDLNDESDALADAIPGSVEVRGSMTNDEKETALIAFARGESRVLVSKPSICGFGMNWQHCANMAFVGVTDSWEAYYQAVRRCYRFGQTRSVSVHIFASELEGAVIKNLKRKESDAAAMAEELSRETSEMVRAEVVGSTRQTNTYGASTAIVVPAWIGAEE
jgi:hypothetical protein